MITSLSLSPSFSRGSVAYVTSVFHTLVRSRCGTDTSKETADAKRAATRDYDKNRTRRPAKPSTRRGREEAGEAERTAKTTRTTSCSSGNACYRGRRCQSIAENSAQARSIRSALSPVVDGEGSTFATTLIVVVDDDELSLDDVHGEPSDRADVDSRRARRILFDRHTHHLLCTTPFSRRD